MAILIKNCWYPYHTKAEMIRQMKNSGKNCRGFYSMEKKQVKAIYYDYLDKRFNNKSRSGVAYLETIVTTTTPR